MLKLQLLSGSARAVERGPERRLSFFATAARIVSVLLPLLVIAVFLPAARAGVITPDLSKFTLTNTFDTDGSMIISSDRLSFVLTGGNSGSGINGTTTFSAVAALSGMVDFQYSYASLDDPGFDSAGYLINTFLNQLADTDGESGSGSFSVTAGQTFGWWVATQDNEGEPGILTVSLTPATTATPEPGAFSLMLSGLALAAVITGSRLYRRTRVSVVLTFFALSAGLSAQNTQNHFLATNATGQLVLTRTFNPLQFAATSQSSAHAVHSLSRSELTRIGGGLGPEVSPFASLLPHPSFIYGAERSAVVDPRLAARSVFTGAARLRMQSLTVSGPSPFGFDGVTHSDQRLASSGNQFSVEPPNPSIAVANGFIVEGVNNAFRVYTTAGIALTPVIASDQLFGVPPEIDRSTGLFGVNPTDMRVYFDQDINRWFIMQRAQDNDVFRTPLNSSHIYMAVSQTADPTGTYNIYVMDSSDTQNTSCPCIPDYPQIGSDHYGFYISANEYNTSAIEFVDSTILAISKTALGSGVKSPAMYRFNISGGTGYEFAIQPATTPPGAVQFLANGGLEYFVSSQSAFGFDSNLAIWALTNTASLQSTSGASLLLTQTTVPTEIYAFPEPVTQKPGTIPYGDSLFEPIAFIDGGPDSRVQSVVYSGGRLFVTLPSEVADDNQQAVVGGAYVILSPTYRNLTLGASVVKQGYLYTNNNNLLRPSVSVNAQGRGAIAFTLAGPDYYPSAAFVTIDTTTAPPSSIFVANAGSGPEDGFTGYPGGAFPGTARWGDYSTTVTSTDGKIWMVSEYIPNLPRTQLANWGTFIYDFVP